jgi:hypothetical protein
MNKFVSKAALIAAVAASCGYATAATTGPKTGLDYQKRVSLEGAKLGTGAGLVNKSLRFNMTVTTEVSHFAGDEWQLTLTKGSWATSGASGFAVTCSDGDITLDAIPTISGANMVFTVAGTSGTTASTECVFTSLGVAATSLTTSGNVSVTFGAKRPSSSAFDRDLGSTATANAFSVASQLLSTVSVQSAFNGTVDYQGSAGKGFASDDGTNLVDGKEDSLVILLAKSTVDTEYSLTGTASLTVVLTAESGKSFSFLDANRDGAYTADEWETPTANGDVSSTSGSITINTTGTELTFKALVNVPGATADSRTFTIAVGSRFASPSVGTVGNTLTPMDFPSTAAAKAVSANLAIGSTTLQSSDALDAGLWDSNGSTVYIPYMPVNTVAASRIAPVVYITNRSAVSGPATATMRNENGVECTAALGTISANRTTNVSNLINDAVKACYNTSSAAEAAGHRLSITITASLPSADTEVYSAFTVGGTSRVSVVNSSNGAK